MKIIILFPLFGAYRKSEVLALTPDDVSDADSHLLVSIRASKTGPRSFVLVGFNDPKLDAFHYFRSYFNLRLSDASTRLFCDTEMASARNSLLGST